MSNTNGTFIKKVRGPKFLVVIPQDVRELLRIQDGDYVEILIKKKEAQPVAN